jgi:hypothetical protein
MIENAYSELPETKQQYFKEVLNLKTVNNQSRYIYKFKQTTSNKMWFISILTNSVTILLKRVILYFIFTL